MNIHKKWINTESSKRIIQPSWNDYSCYSKIVNGGKCLVTNSGIIVATFSDLEDYERICQPMIDGVKQVYLALNERFLRHKSANPNYYVNTYEEANFTHKLIYLGFECSHDINPYNNWYGISKQEPDMVFKKGDIKIVFSLNGACTPYPSKNNEHFNNISNALSNCACKFIGVYKESNILYEDWFGKTPELEFIKSLVR